MPTLALAVPATAIRLIDLEPDERCSEGVCYLSNEHNVASENVVEVDDIVKVYEQVGEPHRSTQVVEYVPDSICQLLYAT